MRHRRSPQILLYHARGADTMATTGSRGHRVECTVRREARSGRRPMTGDAARRMPGTGLLSGATGMGRRAHSRAARCKASCASRSTGRRAVATSVATRSSRDHGAGSGGAGSRIHPPAGWPSLATTSANGGSGAGSASHPTAKRPAAAKAAATSAHPPVHHHGCRCISVSMSPTAVFRRHRVGRRPFGPGTSSVRPSFFGRQPLCRRRRTG